MTKMQVVMWIALVLLIVAGAVSWLDVVLPLTLGSIWLGCFVWQLRGRAILPVNDPQFDETIGRIIERTTTVNNTLTAAQVNSGVYNLSANVFSFTLKGSF